MVTETGQIIPEMRHNKQTMTLRDLRKRGRVIMGDRVCVMWGKGHFFGVVTGEYQHAANGFDIGGHIWIVTDDDGRQRKVCHDLVWLARVEHTG